MKFCTDHWTKMREKVIELGMGSLIAKSGEEILAKQVEELKGNASKSTFDPLMAAHNMIVSFAVEMVGLDIMMDNEDGTPRCPICYLQAGHLATCKEPDCTWTYESIWISGAVGKSLSEAKRLGLVSES
jgi:hypothetical protein